VKFRQISFDSACFLQEISPCIMMLPCNFRFSTLMHNGYVYETFGISKHFPVKLQLLLIRAETLDIPLIAKCFIYDVGGSFYSNSTPVISVLIFSIR